MNERRLRVMTYNLHFGIGMDKKPDFERIAEVIERVDPDVAGVEEVVINGSSTPGLDSLDFLGNRLKTHGVFAKTIPINEGKGEYGIGLLARHAVETMEILPLPVANGAEPRVALVVRMNVPREFYFIVTHFSCEAEFEDYRIQSARAITNMVREKNYTPAVLVGDFNSETNAPCLDEVRKNWTVCNDANPAPSFPADSPNRLLDYICFYPKDAFNIIEHEIVDERIASDHRPALAVLESR